MIICHHTVRGVSLVMNTLSFTLDYQLVKPIFDHVFKGLPTDGVTKLSKFQEFMCMMLKLRTCAPNEGLVYQFGVSEATISGDLSISELSLSIIETVDEETDCSIISSNFLFLPHTDVKSIFLIG